MSFGPVSFFENFICTVFWTQAEQIWRQLLSGADKDTYPVLAGESEKKVYKITFATAANAEYAAAYVNPDGTVALLTTNPTAADGYAFYKWSKTNEADGEEFTASTAVTGDTTVYAVSEEKYGENDVTKTVTATYGTGAAQDLSEYAVFATGTASAGKFTYTITFVNYDNEVLQSKTSKSLINTRFLFVLGFLRRLSNRLLFGFNSFIRF